MVKDDNKKTDTVLVTQHLELRQNLNDNTKKNQAKCRQSIWHVRILQEYKTWADEMLTGNN